MKTKQERTISERARIKALVALDNAAHSLTEAYGTLSNTSRGLADRYRDKIAEQRRAAINLVDDVLSWKADYVAENGTVWTIRHEWPPVPAPYGWWSAAREDDWEVHEDGPRLSGLLEHIETWEKENAE